jgi:glycosyltransferase involved in cell wall biosynthesis
MMKNIVILATAYPNIYNEYSSIFVQDQARALAKHENVNVNVVGAMPISFKDIWKKKLFRFGLFRYKKNDINVALFLFPSIPKLKIFNNLIRYILNRGLLVKYSKVFKIDLIHVHNSVAGEAALWCKNRLNIPYCVTEHSTAYARDLVKENEVSKYKRIYQNSECNIAVSKEFCRLLNQKFNLIFEYIPNIVDTEFFMPLKDGNTSEKFKFINIAYLEKKKNHINLIKAFYKEFKGDESVNLSILGNGSEYKNIKKEIELHGMEKQIKLHGFATRDKVLKELQSSNAFVLSSDHETFGVVLIEAMSCGLPVIATKCGGPESIVRERRLGLLVEKENDKELANAMLKVYNNKYDREYIRNYCIENFSENIVVDQLIHVYNKVVNENRHT